MSLPAVSVHAMCAIDALATPYMLDADAVIASTDPHNGQPIQVTVTRLRLVHALHRGGEVRVTDLAAEVAMSQQAVSNQLQRLVDQRIVAARRDGNNIYYRIVDGCVPRLLELGWCLYDTTRQDG